MENNIKSLLFEFVSEKEPVRKIGIIKDYSQRNNLRFVDFLLDFLKYIEGFSTEMETLKSVWINNLGFCEIDGSTDSEGRIVDLNLEMNAEFNSYIELKDEEENRNRYRMRDWLIDKRIIEQEIDSQLSKKEAEINKSLKDLREYEVKDATGQSMVIFKSYFKFAFLRDNGDEGSLMDRLINDMKKDRDKAGYASIALLILNSNAIKTATDKKKISFAKWYTKFCDAFGLEKATYKPNRISTKEYEAEFYYIIEFK